MQLLTKSQLTIGALFALSASFSFHLPSFAAEAVVSEGELVTILRATKVVPVDSKLTASISGDEVVVTTEKKDDATDDACKIEAVLIAKTVFESVKNDAQRTKVILFDLKSNHYSEVAVKRAEVKMYGSGQLTEKELLSSLEIKKGDEESAADASIKVAPGPMRTERAFLKARLLRLEKEGSGVKDLLGDFDRLEELAKAGDAEQVSALNRELKPKIAAREQAFREAKRHENAVSSQAISPGTFNPPPGRGAVDKGLNFSQWISSLMLDPHTKRPMYNFSVNDLPLPNHGRGPVVFYLKCIHAQARQGKNVQSLIATMNSAMHALKTNDPNTYDACMSEFVRQMGPPPIVNKNASPFGGKSNFPRIRN